MFGLMTIAKESLLKSGEESLQKHGFIQCSMNLDMPLTVARKVSLIEAGNYLKLEKA
jgi:hypothetical protein